MDMREACNSGTLDSFKDISESLTDLKRFGVEG
jgi:hypothetical protein